MPFCTACGRQNPDDARFCSQCGTRLVAPEPPVDAAAVDALPVGSALLVVQKGPGAGSRFLLDLDVVNAGRHPDSEIFLDDVTVSRRHAVFNRTADGYTVSDVGSLNGTYVNRDRIETIALKDSDEVQIGKYRLVFFAGHEDV